MCRKTHDCWVSLMDIKAEHINEMRNAVEGPGEQIPTRFLQHNTNHNAYRLVGTAGRTMPRWGVDNSVNKRKRAHDGAVAGGQEGSQSAHSNSAELPAAGMGPVAGIKGLVPVHIITEGGQITAFFNWDSRNVTLETGEVMSAEGFCIKCGGRGKDWRKAIVVEGARGVSEDMLMDDWLKQLCCTCKFPIYGDQIVRCQGENCDRVYHRDCRDARVECFICPECVETD